MTTSPTTPEQDRPPGRDDGVRGKRAARVPTDAGRPALGLIGDFLAFTSRVDASLQGRVVEASGDQSGSSSQESPSRIA